MSNPMGKYAAIIDAKSPLWSANHLDWEKWWSVYEGGSKFVDKFIKQYPREANDAFKIRKEMSHNPAHAKSTIQTIRNSLSAKLPDVIRKGDEIYLEAIKKDIDRRSNSMSSYLTSTIMPSVLVTGADYVWIDAPPKMRGESMQDSEDTAPYIYSYKRWNVLSWRRADRDDKLLAVLLREHVPTFNTSGLQTGLVVQYKYAAINEAGTVSVIQIDQGGNPVHKNDEEIRVIDIPVIPLVEILITEPLMKDIADIQISIMNNRSGTNSSLWKTNFSLFVEPYDEKNRQKNIARSKATTQRNTGSAADVRAESVAAKNVTVIGAGQSYQYDKDAGPPSWIAPPATSITTAIQYEEVLAKEIRILTNIALTSITVKALEQSGASKEMDRIGEEAALLAIAAILQSGENEISKIYHMYLGKPEQEINVKYPDSFQLLTIAETLAIAESLRKLSDAVPSAKYQKAVQQLLSVHLLKGWITSEDIEAIALEINEATYVETSAARQKAVIDDINSGILSRKTGAEALGWSEDEIDEVLEEQKAEALSILDIDSANVGANLPNG